MYHLFNWDTYVASDLVEFKPEHPLDKAKLDKAQANGDYVIPPIRSFLLVCVGFLAIFVFSKLDGHRLAWIDSVQIWRYLSIEFYYLTTATYFATATSAPTISLIVDYRRSSNPPYLTTIAALFALILFSIFSCLPQVQ
ncbi:MAG: hypothetical protein AAF939_02795 [Planctomycetota bacterium]